MCHLCENKCENRYELKKHLITHSYKEAKYMCSECDFMCQNEVSMEVHIGKQHSVDISEILEDASLVTVNSSIF